MVATLFAWIFLCPTYTFVFAASVTGSAFIRTLRLYWENKKKQDCREVSIDFVCCTTGNIRRFRRICEHIQSMVCVSRRVAPPASPRAKRRSTRGGELSESESIGSDTSERMSDRLAPLPSPRQVLYSEFTNQFASFQLKTGF